jgi:hypothetical protein
MPQYMIRNGDMVVEFDDEPGGPTGRRDVRVLHRGVEAWAGTMNAQGDGNWVLYGSDGKAEWASGTFIQKPPPAPIPPVEGALSRLSVRPGYRFLFDDTGQPVDIREATLFSAYRLWLDGRKAELQTTLDTLQREGGINSVRVLLSLGGDFWEGHGTDPTEPGFFGNLVPFARFLAGSGFYWHCCLFGSVSRFGAVPNAHRGDVVTDHPDVIQRMHQYVNQVTDTLDGEPNCVFQIANEPNQIGFGTDSQVILDLGTEARRILSLSGRDDAPLDLGAQGEGEHFYHQAPATTFAYHLHRAGTDDHFYDLKRLIGGDADISGPVYDEEAMNLGDLSRLDGRSDLADGTESTATAFALAVCSRIKRVAIAAFHSHEGLWSRCDRPKTIASLRAWRRGLDLVPLGGGGAQWNGGHTGSMLSDVEETFPPHITNDADLPGPLRVFGLDEWGISLREPVGYDLGVNPDVQTVHIEKWGDWQARLLNR